MMSDNTILDFYKLLRNMNWLNWWCTCFEIGWLCVPFWHALRGIRKP